MRESKVEDYLKEQVEARDGDCFKLQYIARVGAPDRICLLQGWGFFAELKRPGKDAEAHQKREHRKLQRAGFQVFLLDTFEKIDAVMYLYDNRAKKNIR